MRSTEARQEGRTGQDRAGQGRTGQDRAGQGRAGQGRENQGRAGERSANLVGKDSSSKSRAAFDPPRWNRITKGRFDQELAAWVCKDV